jgi:hypothetical protein
MLQVDKWDSIGHLDLLDAQFAAESWDVAFKPLRKRDVVELVSRTGVVPKLASLCPVTAHWSQSTRA